MVHVQLNRLEQDSQDLETYAHRLIEKGKETQAKLILKKKAFIDKTIEIKDRKTGQTEIINISETISKINNN